jgi:hypothetical protein
MELCFSLNSRGKKCGAYAQADSIYCFTHDPNARDRFLEASAEGGRNSTRRRFLDESELSSGVARDILSLVVVRLLTGDLDPRVATPAIRAIVFLCQSIADLRARRLPELSIPPQTAPSADERPLLDDGSPFAWKPPVLVEERASRKVTGPGDFDDLDFGSLAEGGVGQEAAAMPKPPLRQGDGVGRKGTDDDDDLEEPPEFIPVDFAYPHGREY